MTANKTKSSIFSLALILVIAIIGGFLLWRATTWGPWAFSDSSAYLSGARNFIKGRGLVILHSAGYKIQITEFPPLFPVLLGLLSGKDGDFIQVARWMNIILFSGSVFFVGSIIYFVGKSVLLSIFGSAAVALAPIMIEYYSSLMSEPLFIFILLFLVLFVYLFLIKKRNILSFPLLLFSAALPLIRYAGLIFIISIGFFAFIIFKGKKKNGVLKILPYFAFSFLPVSLWLIYLYIHHGKLGGKGFFLSSSFSYEFFQSVGEELNLLKTWIPYMESHAIEWVSFSALILFFIFFLGIISFILFYIFKKPELFSRSNIQLSILLLIMIVFYLTFIALLHTITIPQIDIIPRMLSPLFPLFILLICNLLGFITEQLKEKIFLTFAVCILGVLTIRYYYLSSISIVQNYESEGRGYTARIYQQSGIIEAINKLPDEEPKVSNSAGFVLFHTNRFPYENNQFPNHQFGRGNSYGEKSFREKGAALIILYSDFFNYYGSVAKSLLDSITDNLVIHYKDSEGGIYYYPK